MEFILLIGMPMGWEWLIFLTLLGFPLLLTLFALVNALQSDFSNETNKIAWILTILLFPFLGPLLYFIMSGSQKK